MNSLLEGPMVQDISFMRALWSDPEDRLAAVIQKTLVPSIAHRDATVEAYGRTIPREIVGGDLLDLVVAEHSVMAYVADVSGHGFRAGVLMGMVKTAVRYGLAVRQSLPALLESMNLVLPTVKESSMYATFAGLRFSRSREVEYIAAGHVPLLHYRHRHREVVRRSMSQFPLGMFEDAGYASCRIPYEPGDVFALFTDGLVETLDAEERQFGLERMEDILRDRAVHPTSEIFQATLAAVMRHGEQHDDRTLLVVRALA